MRVLSVRNFCGNCIGPAFYASLIQDTNLREVFNFEATCYVYVNNTERQTDFGSYF